MRFELTLLMCKPTPKINLKKETFLLFFHFYLSLAKTNEQKFFQLDFFLSSLLLITAKKIFFSSKCEFMFRIKRKKKKKELT